MVVPRGSARSIPRAFAHRSEHGDGNPIQTNIPDIPGGGARGPSEATGASSAPRSRRCASMRAMTSGSSMLAITLSRPPQRAQRSISILNIRFSRRAQVMATCRGSRLSAVPARRCAPDPRPAGVTAARSAACGANTP